jgi:ATP-dependent DNA helicase RecQ
MPKLAVVSYLSFFSVQPLCSLCLCGGFSGQSEPQRHKEHRGCTEKSQTKLPTLHLPGTTVIVSPLISLMKDQVDKLEDAGLEASQFNSALSTREHQENLEQIKTENNDFIFVTSERFTTQEFLSQLRKQRINFVVIDEAHCISEWGHDFRSAYLSLGAALKSVGSPPVLALTATATQEVTADIEKQLDIGKLRVIKTGIYRRNIHFEVKRVTNEREKHEQLMRVLRDHQGAGSFIRQRLRPSMY